MQRSRHYFLAAGLTVAALALAGCGGGGSGDATGASGEGGDDLGLVTPGTLTVCSDIPYPPFEVEDADSPTGYSGFDLDLLTAIADSLDLDVSIQDVGFDGLQSGTTLAAGECDIAASAMTITDERKANLDFSDPYYDSLQSLLVRADSGIKGIDDLGGKTVGVQQGTTGESYTEENAPEGTDIVAFPSDGELWPALQAGNIDAILQDLPVNLEHERADSTYSIVEQYQTDEQYGFAFAKGEKTALLDAVNGALAELRDDGTYQEIYDQYFATN